MNVSERAGGIRRVITEVLCAVPESVASFAVKQCSFQTNGVTSAGFALHKRHLNPWLIVLDERAPMREAHCLVAHEIAHALCGHDGSVDRLDAERAACALAAEWGFAGLGADGEHQVAHAIQRSSPSIAKSMVSLRFEGDEVRAQCECGRDADLFVQTFNTPRAEFVALCPPCDRVEHFIAAIPCPCCKGLALATWLRRFWWVPHLERGRVAHILRVLAQDAAGWLRGEGWPKRPPILYLRCHGCGWRAMAFVRPAERASMLPLRDDSEPDALTGDRLWRVLTGGA